MQPQKEYADALKKLTGLRIQNLIKGATFEKIKRQYKKLKKLTLGF